MTQYTKPIELASNEYIEMRHTASGSEISAGVLQSIEDVVCFSAFEDIAVGEKGSLVISTDRVSCEKADTETFSAGDKVFYDPDEDNVRAEGSKEAGDFMIGYALKPSGSGESYVEASFEGRGVTAES